MLSAQYCAWHVTSDPKRYLLLLLLLPFTDALGQITDAPGVRWCSSDWRRLREEEGWEERQNVNKLRVEGKEFHAGQTQKAGVQRPD